MVEPTEKKLKAVVFGASGGTGREVVSELLASPKWDQVTVVVRKKIERWDSLPEDQKKKLNIVFCDDFEQLQDLQKWQFSGYNSLFCCLGSLSTKYGNKIFYQVDHDYTLQTAKIAQSSKIPHFGLISSGMANAKSFSFYLKVKGETENDIIALGLPLTSIFRPGLLVDRDTDKRFIEKVLNYVPFLPKIECRDVGRVVRMEAEMRHDPTLNEQLDNKLKLKKNGKEGMLHYFYENSYMLNLLKFNI